MQEEKRDPRKRYLTIVPAVLYVMALVAGLVAQNIGLVILLAAVLLVYTVFLSQNGSEKLKSLHNSFFVAIRQNGNPTVSVRRLLLFTLQQSSPFYCFWVLTGLFIPGGCEAWLVTGIPTLFLSFIAFHGTSDLWKELGLRRLYFWGMQLGCYLLAVCPGLLLLFL